MSEAKIENDQIVIRVPITALENAVTYAWDNEYGFKQHALYIEDVNEFAKELVRALNTEEENGETLITKAFDKATINATENGAFGINDRNNPN
jgi:hypothetical protein